jgi:hypothetical protein
MEITSAIARAKSLATLKARSCLHLLLMILAVVQVSFRVSEYSLHSVIETDKEFYTDEKK